MHHDRPGVRPFVLLCSAGAIAALGGQYIVVVSPYIREVLALQPEALGLLLSAPVFSGVAGALLGGWLADTGRVRTTLVAGLTVLCAGYLVCAVPPEYAVELAGAGGMSLTMTRPGMEVLLTGNLLIGLGSAAFGTVVNVAILRTYPDRARRFLTLYQVTLSAVGTVAPLVWDAVFHVVLESRIGASGVALQSLFGVSVACCALAIVPIMRERFAAAPSEPDDPASQARASRAIFGLPFVVICVFVSLHSGADTGLYYWVPDFVSRTFDPVAFPPAWILSAYSGAYFVGRFILANLPDRWSELSIITLAAGFGGLFNLIAFQSGNQYLLAGFYTAAGLAPFHRLPIHDGLHREAVPEGRGPGAGRVGGRRGGRCRSPCRR